MVRGKSAGLSRLPARYRRDRLRILYKCFKKKSLTERQRPGGARLAKREHRPQAKRGGLASENGFTWHAGRDALAAAFRSSPMRFIRFAITLFCLGLLPGLPAAARPINLFLQLRR